MRRRFAPDVLDQLALIVLGQAGGLSLDEIRAMLPADGAPQVDRNVLLARAEKIDATIKYLRTMSEGLRHASECSAAQPCAVPDCAAVTQGGCGKVEAKQDGGSKAVTSRIASALL